MSLFRVCEFVSLNRSRNFASLRVWGGGVTRKFPKQNGKKKTIRVASRRELLAAALQETSICAPKLGYRTPLTGVLRGSPAGLSRARSFSATAPPVRLGGVTQRVPRFFPRKLEIRNFCNPCRELANSQLAKLPKTHKLANSHQTHSMVPITFYSVCAPVYSSK